MEEEADWRICSSSGPGDAQWSLSTVWMENFEGTVAQNADPKSLETHSPVLSLCSELNIARI